MRTKLWRIFKLKCITKKKLKNISQWWYHQKTPWKEHLNGYDEWSIKNKKSFNNKYKENCIWDYKYYRPHYKKIEKENINNYYEYGN